jgi:hypothetical protein
VEPSGTKQRAEEHLRLLSHWCPITLSASGMLLIAFHDKWLASEMLLRAFCVKWLASEIFLRAFCGK